MPLLSSLALPAQTAAGATSVTLVDAYELADSTGSGVSRVVIVPPPGYATVTGVATNNVTFNVRQLRAGTPVGTFASLVLAVGSNLVAETPIAVPITGAPVLLQDDVIDVQMVQNAAGIAVGAGLVVEVDIN
jgi:hypothetical protein